MRQLIASIVAGSVLVAMGTVDVQADTETPSRFVVAVGDIACGKGVTRTATTCHEDAVAALFSASGPLSGATAILPLGDLQYPSGKYGDFIYTKPGCVVDGDGGTAPCSFHGSFGAAQASTGAEWRPTPGNHEYTDPTVPTADCPRLRGTTSGGATYSACGYERYFGSAVAAPTVNGDGLGDYWFTYDLGEAHPMLFISLNVGRCERNGVFCASGGQVTSFLTQTLASDAINPPSACVVAYWHQPRWSRYGHKNSGKASGVWAGLFSVAGAKLPDLVVNGHAHNYQRFAPLNKVGESGTLSPSIQEIIVGTGGNDLEADPQTNANPNRPPPPERFSPDTFGILRLGWDPVTGSLSTSFVAEGSGGTSDSQAWACH